jgi:hypothetical protein
MLSFLALAAIMVAQATNSDNATIGLADSPASTAFETVFATPISDSVLGYPSINKNTSTPPPANAADNLASQYPTTSSVKQASYQSSTSSATQAVATATEPAELPEATDMSVGLLSESMTGDSAARDSSYMTREQVQAEIKKAGLCKGEFHFVPYGTIWGDTSYDSQRSKIGDYCLWIESPTTHPNDPDYNVDAKSTRIGLDMFGPGIPCFDDAKISGKVEVDFQGYFVTRNKPGLLLRHAYVEAKNADYRILVGQTWDVISPLAIPTLNYTAGSAVGNLGYRRAQFRVERYIPYSETMMSTLQGSINANVVTDYVSETGVSADPGPYPDVQARWALTLGERTGPDARPIVLGIGGHVGEQEFDFRTDATPDLSVSRTTWSVDADLYIPITDRLGFQGELFHGENLSNYMGGILQGVDRVTYQAIHATGGWFDIWYKWQPNICTHTGYSVDDPLDKDITMATGKTLNQMIFTNVLYDVTKNLQIGFEVDVWKTLYKTLAAADAVRLDVGVKYTF